MATNPDQRIFDRQTHLEVVHTNKFSLSDQTTPDINDKSGWYYSENAFNNIQYITDQGDVLVVEGWITGTGNKPFGLDRLNPTFVFNLYKVYGQDPLLGGTYNTFSSPDDYEFGYSYIYDANQQQFSSDQNSLTTVYLQGIDITLPLVMRKWRNPDARMWDFNLRLNDPGAIFNSFQAFFKYTYDFYKSSRISGFTVSAPVEPLLGINPLNLDFSKVRRNFAGKTRYEYDAFYTLLTTTGELVKHNVTKIVYWPEPTLAPPLSAPARAAIIGDINQQRQGFLAIYVDSPADRFCKFIQGTKVTLRNTGVARLDDKPIRIFFSGNHNGPNPGPEFVNPSFFDNYNYYTLKLQLILTAANNVIRYRRNGGPIMSIVIPEGMWYTSELLTYINKNYSFLYLTFIAEYNSTFPTAPEQPSTGILSTQALPWLVFAAENNTTIYGPNAATPSTFLGPQGWDLGYVFPPSNSLTAVDEIVFTLQDTPSQINTFTPLTTDEIEALVANIPNVTAEKQLGPVRNDMPYDEFFACEVNLALYASTEVHTNLAAWALRVENNDRYVFEDFEDLKAVLNAAELNYDIQYGTNGAGSPAGLYFLRFFSGFGIGGEMSENYRPGVNYRDSINTVSNTAKVEWLFPNKQNIVPAGATISYGGDDPLPIGGRNVEVAALNYMEDARWVTTFPIPSGPQQGLSAFGFLNYAYYETVFSDNPNRLDGGFITGPFTTIRANTVAIGTGFSAVSGELVVANPPTANGPVGNVSGKIALVARSAFNPSTAILNCLNGGAIAVVMYNNTAAGVFQVTPNVDLPVRDIPVMSVSQADGLALAGSAPVTITLTASQVVPGEYLVGYLKEERVRQILNRPVGNVPVIGTFTYYSSDFNIAGNPTLYRWYLPDGTLVFRGANFMAATIMNYYNINNVQHIWVDCLNTSGGNYQVIDAMIGQMGANRRQRCDYNYGGNLTRLQTFDDLGTSTQCAAINLRYNAENEGLYNYRRIGGVRYTDHLIDLVPETTLNRFPNLNPVFGGPAPASGLAPGILNEERVVLWTSVSTTISATQGAYLSIKGASLTTAYDGAFGNNVQAIVYGAYDRSFSTGGNYRSFLNYYPRNRDGTEELTIPPMLSIDRCELGMVDIMDGNVMKNAGQDFTRFHQPNIQWNMSATNYYQDIGFTLDTPAEVTYGANWVPKRYNDVDFEDYTTWRHTILERSVQMMCDPAVNTQFFQPGNTYGYL